MPVSALQLRVAPCVSMSMKFDESRSRQTAAEHHSGTGATSA